MVTRIDAPALVYSPWDAGRYAPALLRAVRLYISRGLVADPILVELSDDFHRHAGMAREYPQVTPPCGHRSAGMADELAVLATRQSLTVDEAAALMGVGPEHVRRLCRQSAVSAVKAAGGGSWAVDTSSALAWAASRDQDPRRKAA